MIRASDEEIETALHIAVTTAPNYVLREVFVGKFDRERAVETIVQRVFAALRRYELMREPRAEEIARAMLPLFANDRPTAAEVPTLFEHDEAERQSAVPEKCR